MFIFLFFLSRLSLKELLTYIQINGDTFELYNSPIVVVQFNSNIIPL